MAVLTRAERVAFDLKNLTSGLRSARENVGLDGHDSELKAAIDEAVQILLGDVDGSQPSSPLSLATATTVSSATQ